jgi:prevent-host-death family protein
MAVEVGVRAFRGQLSHWLERAASGEEVIVTQRGRPLARLTGLDGRTTRQRLVDEGLVTPARRPKRPIDLNDLVPVRGSVTELLLQDRKRGY